MVDDGVGIDDSWDVDLFFVEFEIGNVFCLLLDVGVVWDF